jgi:hypothetical protein
VNFLKFIRGGKEPKKKVPDAIECPQCGAHLWAMCEVCGRRGIKLTSGMRIGPFIIRKADDGRKQ